MKKMFQKQALLTARFVLAIIFTINAGYNEVLAENADYSDCWFLKDKPTAKPEPLAVQFVEYIRKVAKIEKTFVIVATDLRAEKTVAVAFQCFNKDFIAYDMNTDHFWFNGKVTDHYAAGTMIHEIGHHYYNHTSSGPLSEIERKRDEVEAEYFTGMVFQALGATLEQALLRSHRYPETYRKSHPPRSILAAAIKQGWRDAEVQSLLRQERCDKSEWIGEEFEVEFQMCRQFKDCRSGQPIYRVACEADIGEWTTQ